MPLGGYTLAPGPEWTSLAATWPVRCVSRGTEPGHHLGPRSQTHLVCQDCGQSAYCLSPDATAPGYVVSVAEILAGVLAHIREAHPSRVIPSVPPAL